MAQDKNIEFVRYSAIYMCHWIKILIQNRGHASII